MFDEPTKLLLGLVTGLAFGILLQKGQVSKYPVLMGQLLLRNWTVAKIMATAVLVGSIGVYLLIELGLAQLHLKPATLAPLLVGAGLFGTGLAIFGLCPGTSVAACAEGQRDAMVGVAGMFGGALLYVATESFWKSTAGWLPDLGKITLAQLTETSPWLWIGLMVAAAAGVAAAGLLKSQSQSPKVAEAR